MKRSKGSAWRRNNERRKTRENVSSSSSSDRTGAEMRSEATTTDQGEAQARPACRRDQESRERERER
jgi:hypothetical protein